MASYEWEELYGPNRIASLDLSVYRSTHTNGFQLEYNGAPAPVSASGTYCPFDTMYLADDGRTSVPIGEGDENEYVRVIPGSGGVTGTAFIYPLRDGLWKVQVIVDFAGPLTKRAHVTTGFGQFFFEPGFNEMNVSVLTLLAAEVPGSPNPVEAIVALHADDAALNVNYAWISLVPVLLGAG